MAKKSKSEALIEEEELSNSENETVFVDEDEDDEANEDLSLKIVQKAMLRGCSNNFIEEEDEEAEDLRDSKRENKDPVSNGVDKSVESFGSDMFPADIVREDENVETNITDIVCNVAEKNPAETSDNIVLRRLLRGPRYFDAPDKSWGTCYNCGEEGHAAVNCTSARRKKPCFVCGSFDHNAKNCAKGKACFICKKSGHRANDCPERSQGQSQSSKLCLKCGESGHDMFSCRNSYSADDLKEIQCYTCKRFGHLCCAKLPDGGPREFSCYRCGLIGHTGLACTASRGETSGPGSLSSCYKCGEEGHFARECTNTSKSNKRNGGFSTPKKKVPKKRKEKTETKSAPRDFGRAWKKKGKNEGRFSSSSKRKGRGGWIMDDPDDYPQPNKWKSPSTPRNKRAKIPNFSPGGHASSSRSYRKSNNLDFDYSASYGSDQYHRQHYHHQHNFSASRFGSSSRDRWRRNYDDW